jgi:hypothetical protein
MSAREEAQALRHDLKYTGLTALNLDASQPCPAWAQKALRKDLWETRRGLSCLALCEASAPILSRFSAEFSGLLGAARALLQHDLSSPQLESLQAEVRALLRAADALVDAARSESP